MISRVVYSPRVVDSHLPYSAFLFAQLLNVKAGFEGELLLRDRELRQGASLISELVPPCKGDRIDLLCKTRVRWATTKIIPLVQAGNLPRHNRLTIILGANMTIQHKTVYVCMSGSPPPTARLGLPDQNQPRHTRLQQF
jgi:hypothetical protein